MKGVKYPTILFLFPLFDVIWGLPVDYMHAVCLGVAKRFTSLWFDSSQSCSQWYLGNRISEIESALRQTKPPRTIKSHPRPIREKQHWKGPSPSFFFFFSILLRLFSPLLRVAIELRNWLLFFAPVVLEGFLPGEYYKNLMVLVEVLHLLLSRNISVRALDNAEHNLKVFLESFEALYGCVPS